MPSFANANLKENYLKKIFLFMTVPRQDGGSCPTLSQTIPA